MKEQIYRLFKKGFLNSRFVLLADLLLAVIISLCSIGLTCYFLPGCQFSAQRRPIMIILAIVTLVSTLAFSLAFRTHRQLFRFSSFRITRGIGMVTLTNAVVITLIAHLILRAVGIPLEFRPAFLFFLLFSALLFTSFVVVRLMMIMVARWVKSFNPKIIKQKARVLIFDVRDISVAAAKQLEDSPYFHVVGYCSREEGSNEYQIDGHPIYHISDTKELAQLVHEKNLQGIIFPAKKDFLRERESFIYSCESVGLHTYLMPGISESSATMIATESVQRIKIEDLLMREEIHHSNSSVAEMFRDKVVMVTGAAGSIGSELVKQIATLPIKKLVLFDNAETPLHELRLYLQKNHPSLHFIPVIGDVRSEPRLRYTFEQHHPDIVLHAAAYKHVPLMEENPCESALVNIVGTRHVADLCLEFGVERMVMVSTDKAVNPTNVMGACKRAAEMYVQSLGKELKEGTREGKTIFVTTRFGNVLGSQGSVIHLFREQIAEGGPITVTHPDIVRYFMSIPEACSLILEAATLATEAQIYVFDMGEEHKIVDLARNMIRLAGLEPDKDIKIEFTGLRPGEKLYEEVLSTKENTLPTKIDKVMIARIRPVDHTEILPRYDELEQLASANRPEATVRTLKALVPEYKSANSRYEALDHEQTPNPTETIQQKHE